MIGDWLVTPEADSLERAGSLVKVEPRYMDLLAYLARHPGQVVSSDEIHGQVWAGVVVGDHAVYQAVARLRKVLGDRSDKPRYIETVPKRGYRLLLPVIPVEAEGTTGEGDAAPCGGRQGRSGAGAFFAVGRWRVWGGGLLILVVLATALLWRITMDPGSPSGGGQTLAVLPFQMPDSQARKGYIAYGLTTNLLNHLGRVKDLEVLGQISTSRFKGSERNLREIGRRLAVGLLVLGRVRADGARLEVDIELVDVGSGERVWSEHFERDSSEIFVLQEEMAERLVSALGLSYTPNLDPYRQSPTETTLSAYDFYLLGQFYEKDRSRRSLERALEMYRKAIATDPELSGGYRGVASASLLLTYYGEMSLSQAEEVALHNLERALELDPEEEANYGVMGLARYLRGEYGPAVEGLRRALSLNGNYAIAWMWLGMALEKQGKLDQAIEYYRHAVRLEPLSVVVNSSLAEALRSAGNPEQALSRMDVISDSESASVQYNLVRADLLLQQGKLAAAYRHARRALELDPADSLATAQLALVLQDLGQQEEQKRLFEQVLDRGLIGKTGALMALEGIYLRLDPGSRTTVEKLIYRLFPDARHIAQIRWRRRTAFRGLSFTYGRRYDKAAEQLELVLQGGGYAIVGTDFDLLYCTALAFGQLAGGKKRAAGETLTGCEKQLQQAQRWGWNSQWTTYTAAQMAVLSRRYEEAVTLLEALYDRGFNGTGLLQNDPLLDAIRQRPGFSALLEKMQRRAAAAWDEIDQAPAATAD